MAQLLDALAVLRLLPCGGLAPGLEQAALAGGNTAGIGRDARKIRRKLDLLRIVPLRHEPRLATGELDQLRDDDAECGARLRIVETQQNVVGGNGIAILDEDLADHATRWVLDLLAVAVDHDQPRGDNRAGERGNRRPAADAEHEEARHDETGDQPAPQAEVRSRWQHGLDRRCRLRKRSATLATGSPLLMTRSIPAS